MEKIKILTDSCLDIPEELIEKNNIDILPVLINFEDKSYKDKEEINLDELEDMIVEMLFKDLESVELYIPYSDGSVYSELKQKYEMLDEQYLDNGIYLSLFISQKDKHKFKKYIYRNVN